MKIQNNNLGFAGKESALRGFIKNNPTAKISIGKEGDKFTATLLKADKGPYTMVTTDLFPANTKTGALKRLVKIFDQVKGKSN